jgi:hypothetical protein
MTRYKELYNVLRNNAIYYMAQFISLPLKSNEEDLISYTAKGSRLQLELHRFFENLHFSI